MPRIQFTAITTDVRGLRNLERDLAIALTRTNRRFRKDLDKVGSQFTGEKRPIFSSNLKYGRPPSDNHGWGTAAPMSIGSFASVGRGDGNALYAITMTSNSKIFYYIEAGTSRRYRVMSPDWRSRTRAGYGTRLFPAKGHAMGFDMNPAMAASRAIKPRWFAADVVNRHGPKFIRDVLRIFNGNSITNFFGRTRRE